jgi:hypothetical protein
MSADHVAALPVDQLGLAILNDLIATNQWNEYNYLQAASRTYPRPAAEAIAEAMAWLRARALIARGEGFLGTDAGVSAATITRLTVQWQDEARAFEITTRTDGQGSVNRMCPCGALVKLRRARHHAQERQLVAPLVVQ